MSLRSPRYRTLLGCASEVAAGRYREALQTARAVSRDCSHRSGNADWAASPGPLPFVRHILTWAAGVEARVTAHSGRAAAANRSPTICGESGTTWSSGTGPAAARSVRRARATAVLHEPHVPPLALLVGLAAADGDEDTVAVGRVGDVGPAEGAHLAPAHPGHEEEPRNHGVEAAVLEGDLVGLDAAAATPRPVAGREP